MAKNPSKPKPKQVEVEVAGGRKVKGISTPFETEKEGWNIYRLEDGGRVKIRLLVEDIIVTKEEISKGVPLVVVRQGMVVLYEPPTKGTK